MNIIKKVLGLTFLTLVGMMLSACASSTGTEPVDQAAQPGTAEKTVFIGPVLVDCQGEGPQKCMLVKENPGDEYTLFYDQIGGFDYEEGFEYKLVVREEQVENPPAGGSSLKWYLVRIESKESVPIAGDVVEKTLFVGPELVDCTGVAPQKCMLVKDNPKDEYSFFYDQIEGFDYEEGYEYELVVQVEPVEDPPADASSLKWTLVNVVSKEPVEPADGDKLEGTDWVLVSYLDQAGVMVEVLPDTYTTAVFQDGHVNGNAGCNGYFGEYELDGSNISVGPLASTEMYCGNPPGLMDQELAYLEALGGSTSFSIEQEQLLMENDSGQAVLVYQVAEPKSLTGSLWQVLSFNNGQEAVVSVINGTEISAIFDEEGRLSGSAGCNNYSAPYEVEGEMINIGPGITTRMTCSDPEGIMEQEMQYLAALEMARTYQFENDRLNLMDEEGRQVVNYQLARSFELTETIWHLSAFNNGEGGVVSSLVGTDPTAIFAEDGNISGSAGCNNFSGRYDVDGSEMRIELGPLTMMFCEEPAGVMEQETAYLNALQYVTNFKIMGDVLLMMDAEGQEMLQYNASDIVGYDWIWVEFLENNDNQIAPENPWDYTLRFNPDGQVNIQADCNQVIGSYTLEGSQVNIELGISTLAACPPDSLSDEYLRLLSGAVIYFREGVFLYLDIQMDTGTMRFVE
jgi:heat shock protein HslJ